MIWCEYISDLLPYKDTAGPQTKEFLQKVIDILLEFVRATNDRNEKVTII